MDVKHTEVAPQTLALPQNQTTVWYSAFFVFYKIKDKDSFAGFAHAARSNFCPKSC